MIKFKNNNYLCHADRFAEAPVWGNVEWDVVKIHKKRLSALILDCWKFSQNFFSVKD